MIKIILTGLCMFSPLLALSAQPLLVLGIDSKNIDDLQERLWREEIMRALAQRKIAVVPPMRMETLVREEGIAIRGNSYASARELMNRCGARSVVFFNYTVSGGRYEFRIYGINDGKETKDIIIIDGAGKFGSFCSESSPQIADAIIRMMDGGR